jgi:hypothetical protein
VEKNTKKLKVAYEEKFSLGVLIHQHVRAAVEQAVQEELAAVLGVELYERSEQRRGVRNGAKTRTLTGPTGTAGADAAASSALQARRLGGMVLEAAAALPAARARGE